MSEDPKPAPASASLESCERLERYPREFREREAEALGHAPRVGVALSGGGIRSATFALGLFQGLARLGLLRHVDILSTVSGGGYFGAFLGHLIQRDGEARPGADEGRADRLMSDPRSESIHYLRRNGRFLAPNGTGDLFSALAVALRNWVSVVVVIGLVALLAFTAVSLARYGTQARLLGACAALRWPWPWLSPWTAAAAIAVPLLAVPPAWAYWLVGDNPPHGGVVRAIARWGVAAAGAAVAVVLAARQVGARAWPDCASWTALDWGIAAFVGVSFLTAAWYAAVRVLVWRDPSHLTMRGQLTRWLTRGLTVSGLLALVAVFDTAGTALVHFARAGALVSLVLAALVGLFRSPLLALATRLRAHERPALPMNALLHLTAALVLLVYFGSIASIPHLVALDGAPLPTVLPSPVPAGAMDRLWMLALVVAVVVALSGSLWPFVNRSSMHALYEARLRRAYLGASNPARTDEGLERPPVTEPHEDDGLEWLAYRPHACGGPIHLVNVTINETVDGRSQLQQRDRKGVGMAVGPMGVSVGVKHHAVWKAEEPASLLAHMRRRVSDSIDVLRTTGARRTNERRRFRVFPATARPEHLDVGQWVAISGGAVSPGLGSRTNAALSILTGFFNVRLGYWWRSGVPVHKRDATTALTGTQRVLSLLRGVLPMQFALLDEWFARFPGTARDDWYLTDGGHFENLGAYELLRRELPLIVVSDAEQDERYEFSGLANLVRKARTDFDAEITFLSDRQLRDDRAADAPPVAEDAPRLGTLDALRAHEHAAAAHAAVARIEYHRTDADGNRLPSRWGWLVYLKPTLDGDEPVDVRQYRAEHPAFPHESTGDQFFDEAQWESYRRLGEHTATEVFGAARLGPWVTAIAEGTQP
jgi:hypothetical protein